MAEKWYYQIGDNAQTVVSTRIRLARNLAHYPFPNIMSDAQRTKVIDDVCDAAEHISGLTLTRVDLDTLPQRELLAMIEKNLISVEYAKRTDGVILLSDDEAISIMINEEDHLRIQVYQAGMAPEEAYAIADQVDSALNERLHFAFDERLGYLTQCPTNLGTGMRASLMLHLPSLCEYGSIQSLSGTISKLGLTIRGAHGEGTSSNGAMFQISNQVTLGIDEATAIANLRGIAEQIIKQECALRDKKQSSDAFEDQVWRSLGVLRTARMMSCDEAMKLLSNVRLGVCTDVIDEVSLTIITRLMIDIQSGCLMLSKNEDLSPESRDRVRATMIRELLNN